MLFFLLMQPNHIETLNRKVCMRINDDYYMENIFTLIRVPNDNSKSDEFASRYFCLQSNLTHKVYVVWKRRNQIKRIDKRINYKLNTEVIKCEKSNNLIKNLSIRSKCKLIKLSNKLSEKKIINKNKSFKFKKLTSSKNTSVHQLDFLNLKDDQLSSNDSKENSFKNDNQINKINTFDQIDSIKNNPIYETKKSNKLFKVIKNRFNSNDKIKSSLNNPKYSDLSDKEFNSETNFDNKIYKTNNEDNFKIKCNQSKLSNFINKLSNKAGNTVQYLFKHDKKMKNVKKKVKSAFKNIHHNLVNLVIKNSKID